MEWWRGSRGADAKLDPLAAAMRRNKGKEKGKERKEKKGKEKNSPRDAKSPSLRDTHVVHDSGEEQRAAWKVDLRPVAFFKEATTRLIDLNALTTDGIFRIAGSNEAVSQMKLEMEGGKPAVDVLNACSDVHDVATCLGRWLRDQVRLLFSVSQSPCLPVSQSPCLCLSRAASLGWWPSVQCVPVWRVVH